MKNKKDKTYSIADKTVFQEVLGIIHILHEKEDTIITLNESASYLWKKLIKKVTSEELIDSMQHDFDVDRVTAERDVQEFLNKMKKMRLIK